MPYAKNKIAVKVPHRSGFDKRHRNTGSLVCGALTPVLCDELIPGSRVSLKLNIATQLPPLASDTYMNLKLKAEAFFCPSRLTCASFEDWFNDVNKDVMVGDGFSSLIQKSVVPRVVQMSFNNNSGSAASEFGPGSLADYLGIRVASSGPSAGMPNLNPCPAIAYHLIWQEWYRNPRVQKPAFVPPLSDWQARESSSSSSNRAWHFVSCLPYIYRNEGVSGNNDAINNVIFPYTNKSNVDMLCADSRPFWQLRQRNFGLDYFTGSRVSAQQGPAVSVSVPGIIDNDDITDLSELNDGPTISSFTIAALRASNSLQQFRERNNLASPRFVDQIMSRYGVSLADGVAQRPICIGAVTYDMDSTGVNQTGGSSVETGNPFTSVAAQYGRAYGSGSDFIISDFTANEPGYLMVLISLVPEVTYATGIDRMFTRYLASGSITDMAVSTLQNVGDQPIYAAEIASDFADDTSVFGYQDRYGDWMYKSNTVHGKLRDGESLDAFVLQRSFTDSPELSSQFIEIPGNYLDQVMAVSTAVSGVSAWYDCMLDYKVSMPLAEFSIPSLQDPAYEHGKTVILRRNGQIF